MMSSTTAVFAARTIQGATVAFTNPAARTRAVELGLVATASGAAVEARLLEVVKAVFNDRIVVDASRPLLEALIG